MKISTSKVQQAEFARVLFHAVVPPETSQADIVNPEFFSHVAARLHAGDHIEVVAEDYSFFIELIVLEARTGYARVGVLRNVKLNPAEPTKVPDKGEYFVKWGSAETKFRVIRKSDKVIIKEGIASKADADVLAHKLSAGEAVD